ncbi:hypothetical protein NNJEOMEG_00200 [Fundidesulfovibrio magnetotacticus]|uniref:S-adenosylmethionine:diacylglycerol 3-amino-3-carboxypropyl transferase n=1 Tax=Fundidesulfovibrio magnetotacticus TaxID=2730080 RepID=A0A6V8LVU3_9BACT|nr:BtaA family protein [Fundidesulfovibrio magnetotacticus]GFK92375.1 hypothetical protein NNJEOMEG_00200 [Fundidesulfovibrio magnetotacticus]
MPNQSAALLGAAVRQHPTLSRQGLLERLFCWWFSGMVYNQIWEDPRVDLEALEIGPEHDVLSIASGGCNVCHYLLAGARSVTAVDLNAHHVHLSRLKLEAARRLPGHEAFFRFFGLGGHPDNPRAYREHIEPALPPETARYWSTRPNPLAGPRIAMFRDNLYDRSRTGRFLGLLRALCRLAGRDPARILKAATLEEQREAYRRELEPLFESLPVRLLSRCSPALFSLGVPPQQLRALDGECPGGLLDEYRRRVERLACAFPVADNPFAWQAFSRRYDTARRKALPDYLRPERFSELQEQAPRARVFHDSLQARLERTPARSLDRYALLDAQDWMTPEALRRLWTQIARTARPGARVVFRTGAWDSPLEAALPPSLSRRFRHERERSRELGAKERCAIYGAVHLYVMEG